MSRKRRSEYEENFNRWCSSEEEGENWDDDIYDYDEQADQNQDWNRSSPPKRQRLDDDDLSQQDYGYCPPASPYQVQREQGHHSSRLRNRDDHESGFGAGGGNFYGENFERRLSPQRYRDHYMPNDYVDYDYSPRSVSPSLNHPRYSDHQRASYGTSDRRSYNSASSRSSYSDDYYHTDDRSTCRNPEYVKNRTRSRSPRRRESVSPGRRDSRTVSEHEYPNRSHRNRFSESRSYDDYYHQDQHHSVHSESVSQRHQQNSRDQYHHATGQGPPPERTAKEKAERRPVNMTSTFECDEYPQNSRNLHANPQTSREAERRSAKVTPTSTKCDEYPQNSRNLHANPQTSREAERRSAKVTPTSTKCDEYPPNNRNRRANRQTSTETERGSANVTPNSTKCDEYPPNSRKRRPLQLLEADDGSETDPLASFDQEDFVSLQKEQVINSKKARKTKNTVSKRAKKGKTMPSNRDHEKVMKNDSPRQSTPVDESQIPDISRHFNDLSNVAESSEPINIFETESTMSKCPLCDIVLTTDSKEQHLIAHHSKRFACHLCTDVFEVPEDVSTHIAEIHQLKQHSSSQSSTEESNPIRTIFKKYNMSITSYKFNRMISNLRLKEVEIPGNGFCFTSAVLVALREQGVEKTYNNFAIEVMHEIRTHSSTYSWTKTNDGQETSASASDAAIKACEDFIQAGIFTDEYVDLCIGSAANSLGINLNIIHKNKQTYNLIAHDCTRYPSAINIFLVFHQKNPKHLDAHYNCLTSAEFYKTNKDEISELVIQRLPTANDNHSDMIMAQRLSRQFQNEFQGRRKTRSSKSFPNNEER